MANYTGYIALPYPLGESNTYLFVPAEGWNRDWGNQWGDNISPFRGWNKEWDKNWSSIGSGTREAAGYLQESLAQQSTSRTVHGPISFPQNNFTGVYGTGFGDIFYNRILIEPIAIDFGSIVSDQSVDINIFNGYLDNSTLSDLIQTNFDAGLNLVADTPPTVYFPLEERTYTVEATLNGPPQTDAVLTFDWLTPIPDISIPITGTRIVLLPVTYRAKVKETLLFKTDVLNSYNGTEQRIKIRQNPRQRLAIKAYLDYNERFRVENLIWGWRNRVWAIPMWIEARYATASITEGDTIIYVDTQYGDFREGYLAVVWGGPRNFDVFQIASMTTSSISLDRGVNADYDNPIIMPVRSARMIKDPTRYTTGYDALLDTIVEVTDNLATPAAASAIQYNGEDTFFMEPLQTTNNGSPDRYQHRIDLMDNISGVVEQFSPWNYIRVNREFELIMEGAQEIWEMRQWLYRRAGKLVPFYMPTYENNLRLISVGFITDSFVVKDDDFSTQSSARKTIAVKKTDGTYLFRTIIASEINLDGNTDITVDTPLSIDASEIDEINYFGLKRLSSDDIEIDWLPNNVASVTLPITELSPV